MRVVWHGCDAPCARPCKGVVRAAPILRTGLSAIASHPLADGKDIRPAAFGILLVRMCEKGAGLHFVVVRVCLPSTLRRATAYGLRSALQAPVGRNV